MSTQHHFSDLDHLRERLAYVATGAAGKLVPVIGSGLSRGAVSDTSEMKSLFLAQLSDSMSSGLQARWTAATPAFDQYQQAAEAVGRSRGGKPLTQVIRRAVLGALVGYDSTGNEYTTSELRHLVREGDWTLTKSHRDFARFYAQLPADVRGPIITTNFDPLIEVALREEGIAADAIPIINDSPPSTGHLGNMSAVPVLHIHGYFTEDWSVNSLGQLRAARLSLESLLSALFADSTLLVLGYGGWEDSFMRVLERHAVAQTPLNAEIVWCAFSADRDGTLSNPTLRKLDGAPGFELYSGIDASQLFDAPIGIRARPSSLEVPRGWTPLPVQIDTYRPPAEFSDGATPSWSDAVPRRWPLLSAGQQLLNEIHSAMSVRSDTSVIAAIGPLGEGKSMALRQAAMSISTETKDWTVLWREQAAPPLTPEWLESERIALGDVVLFIDEADLASADIELLQSHTGPERTVLAVATQDRLWWSMPGNVKRAATTVLFDGLTDEDASLLARGWADLDTRPTRLRGGSRIQMTMEEVETELIDATRRDSGTSRSTLFGAILAVRESDSLRLRIAELLDKLSRQRVRAGSDLTLADVFSIICVMQLFVDREGAGAQGASRNLVSAVVNAEDSLANVAVLNALGREANITFAGRFVFARHPMIAKTVFDWLTETERAQHVCTMAAQAGARLKMEGADYDDYAPAYLLGKHIDSYFSRTNASDHGLALAAGLGAIRGAADLLEPRINYLSIARRRDPDLAFKYARGLTHDIINKRDCKTNARVFFNELALVELQQNQPRSALGVAGLVLHDGTGTFADRKKMGYGIATMARAYAALLKQNPSEHLEGAGLLRQVASRLLEQKEYERYVLSFLPQRSIADPYSQLSTGSLLDRLAQAVSSASISAVRELGLPFEINARNSGGRFSILGRLDFSELKVFGLRP